ncbi:uncharacterized protein AKAME5_002787100 [Lates japonicus]|uniref:G-protein coupled receptors family 1 profile domain-containing protein n=1 Tax=Lates japonicus TaxID=270547 RepID=A0AAD3MAM1_LATJO|nr:uncharacterized protein AKAME5_002787100 [Lates japonicus]
MSHPTTHQAYQTGGYNFTAISEALNDSLYDYDYDDEVCEKGEVVQFGSIIVPVFFSLVITLSLTGNILVLVILALYENLKSLTNIFILNLAISDLVFTTGLPFWAIYHIWGWVFSEALCKIVTFVFFTGFYSSILFLTIMTIYRCGCRTNRPIPPQTSTPPYEIHFTLGENGEPSAVTLSGKPNRFKGFLLEARETHALDEGPPVGKFIILDPGNSHLLTCSEQAGSAVSHSNDARKTSVRFNWTALGAEQNITFRATVVQNYDFYWVTLGALVCVVIVINFIELVMVSLSFGSSCEVKEICDHVVKVCAVVHEIFTIAVIFVGILEIDRRPNRTESWLLKVVIAYTAWIFLFDVWVFIFSIYSNIILRRSKIENSKSSGQQGGQQRQKKKLDAAKVTVIAVSGIIIVGTMSFNIAIIAGISKLQEK